ncbi:hypothetical protein D3C81_63630 [compost metagenome]
MMIAGDYPSIMILGRGTQVCPLPGEEYVYLIPATCFLTKISCIMGLSDWVRLKIEYAAIFPLLVNALSLSGCMGIFYHY